MRQRGTLTGVDSWDAVVVGGGAAGLAATLTLARACRSVLMVDAGRPRNRFGVHSHGVLGFDGTPPAALLERAREEVLRYGATVRAGAATEVHHVEGGFGLTIDSQHVVARHLLVATGVRDDLPRVPGLQQQWGRGVVVCPYCDGWESRDSRIGVLGTGRKSLEQAQLLRQWTPDVVLFTDRAIELSQDDRVRLAARDIEVDEREVQGVEARGGTLTGLRIDGRTVPVDKVFTAPRAVPNDSLLRALGAEFEVAPAGPRVRVTGHGATSVDGLWAAGNVVDPSLKVQSAAG